MKSFADMENTLERLGSDWPGDGSVVQRVMQQIASTPARPVSPISPRRRKIMMRSLVGIAATAAVVALLWWGLPSGGGSLYAQVMDAVNKAHTMHSIQYVQPKGGGQPVKATETWFERGVGFREEGLGHICLGNEENLWHFTTERKVAVRSKSNGIDKATEPIFAQIEQFARKLENECERYPAGDHAFDGQPCKAFLLKKLVQCVDDHEKTSEMRVMIFLDQKSRVVRAEYQWREGDHWKTRGFMRHEYDKPIDPALFRPDFGKDVKIVDADAAFDEFVSLKSGVYVEERSGLIYAIHRVERFENGGVLVVSSVRGTAETLKRYPLTKRCVRPGEFLVDGPARNMITTDGSWGLHFAEATHQGIDVCWWANLPGIMKRPNCFEIAPGRLKLSVGVSPHGAFAKLFTDNRAVTNHLTWDIEFNVPQPTAVATVEEVAARVYADQVALEPIPFKSLDIGRWGAGTAVFSDISKTSAAEYVKAIAEKVRSRLESDVDGQIDRLFEPKTQKEIRQWMGNRVAIALSYSPLVDDATLERVAKRPSVTELYLRDTRITDDGLKYLSRLTKLEMLDLAETGITDAGLRRLTGLSSLKHLDLTKTCVTAEGVAMLKRAIPKVEVKWKVKRSP